MRLRLHDDRVSGIQYVVSSTANPRMTTSYGGPSFYMACPSRHDTVRIAQTRRANAGGA